MKKRNIALTTILLRFPSNVRPLWRCLIGALCVSCIWGWGATSALAALPRLTLETNQSSSPLDKGDPNWAANVCGGGTTFSGGARYEWTPVIPGYGQYGSVEAASGWALYPHPSTDDVPFTHPFNKFDFEYLLLPDSQYSTLLAPKNNAEDPERTQARSDAIAQNLLDGTGQPAAANAGFMSVEQDQGLVPDAYRPVVGERVALFGRWIIDCGHDNWQSEIHPPTLTAVARKPVNQRLTHVDIVANPYLVSQEFDHGGIWNQLVYELGLVTDPVPFLVFTDQMTADASVLPPTQGLVVFSFKVRPPTPAESPQDHLFVRMHLTGRHGVVFQPFLLDGETVGVVGLLTDQLTMAARPNNHPYDVTSDELKSVSPDIGRSYAALIGILAIADPVKSVVVSRGIEASLFDTPAPPDLTNAPVMQGWANTNPWGQNPVTYDDSQPFPLIGWMEVQWGTPITPKDVLNSVRIEPWHPVKQMPGGPKKIDEQLAQLVATHPLEGAALAAKTRTAAVLVAQIAPQSAKSVDGVWNYTITWGGKGPAAWGKLTLRTTASAILGVMDTPQGQHLVKGEVIGGGAQILLTISNGKSTSQQVRLNGSPAGYIGVDQQTGTALQLTR